jgi:hypothetical protein
VHAWTFQAREPGDPVGFLKAAAYLPLAGNDQKTSPTVLLI